VGGKKHSGSPDHKRKNAYYRNLKQGRNEGGNGGTIPQAPIHYGSAGSLQGHRITAGRDEKSQQCHKYFLQYSKFAFERTQIWP